MSWGLRKMRSGPELATTCNNASSGLGFRVKGLEIRVLGLGNRNWGLGSCV